MGAEGATHPVRGELIILQLVDVGGTLDLPTVERRLSRTEAGGTPQVGKGTPAYVEFPKPVVATRGAGVWKGPWGEATAQVSVAYYAIGAVSVRIRVPFAVESLEGLKRWAQARVTFGGKELPLSALGRAVLEADRSIWGAAVRESYSTKWIEESYAVFALSDVGMPAEDFMQEREREVAGLLAGADGGRLHEKEVRESLKKWFSYYEDDIAIVDWDAAFVIDPSPEYEDLVFVMEIANLQLLEFRAYDDLLDRAIARGYDELALLYKAGGLFRNPRKTAHDLSLLQMEVAELADEADNITKFLGDWYLARVYAAAQEKFHLAQWRSTVDEKLATLQNLYQMAVHEGDSRRMVILEVLIVLLFILDLVAIILF